MPDETPSAGPDRTIACVFGTRPEVVKMAPVIAALRTSGRYRALVVNTGQHRELLAETLELFDLQPDVALDLMQHGQRLAAFLGRCVEGLDAELLAARPDAVMAEGDTSTVLAAALVAFYQRLPFFHVEAGLRTGQFRNPFPEEMNREIAGRFAALHFAPTPTARANLLSEGVDPESIEVTGNTVIDALLAVRDRRIPHGIALTPKRRLIVVTLHRRESFGAPIRSMLRALRDLAARYRDIEIVLPAHPNPEVRAAVRDAIGADERIRIVDPLPYGPFVTLMDHAHFVVTDSGGIQEEAPALHKPVLVLRETTERPEAIAAGVARLLGNDAGALEHEASRLLDDPAYYSSMARGASPYGDGHAAQRIVSRIDRYFDTAAARDHAR